jgi:hypothetical protein
MLDAYDLPIWGRTATMSAPLPQGADGFSREQMSVWLTLRALPRRAFNVHALLYRHHCCVDGNTIPRAR